MYVHCNVKYKSEIDFSKDDSATNIHYFKKQLLYLELSSLMNKEFCNSMFHIFFTYRNI